MPAWLIFPWTPDPLRAACIAVIMAEAIVIAALAKPENPQDVSISRAEIESNASIQTRNLEADGI
jgi:hypothetical protein